MRTQGRQLLRGSLLLLLTATASYAQEPATSGQGQDQATAPAGGRRQRFNDGQGQPLFGKITAITKDSIEIAKPDGSTATVKVSDKTEFRKDRQPAKPGDFKAGDLVFIRGEENADHSVTALTVGARSGGAMAMGGPGGGPGAGFGEMGKDFLVGEVKSVDAPKLTVLRPDNVTQTLELNEETSLRKGRDSITMADIQAGDHVVIRGGLQNNAFVPKNVIVLSEEQWKRMQEMGMMNGRGPAGNATPGTPPPTAPKSNPPQA
jgi:preprotein translocase subunit YajC